MGSSTLLETSIADFPLSRGKVRDMYDMGDKMLMISTDRISAFDYVIPTGIPDKGRVLTQISAFWFDFLDQENHLISCDLKDMNLPADDDNSSLEGRTMLIRKTKVVPIECVVRGYLAGSGWKEYQKSQSVCEIPLPPGLVESSKIDEPIFTPATKAEEGHDENISFDQMVETVGADVANELRTKSLEIYKAGSEFAASKGIIIADTKFEWGFDGEKFILIDEVLTPDSSRFWPADQYEPGRAQSSFDKQFVRDYLLSTDWDKQSTPPELPNDVVAKTREKYIDAFEQLTGTSFPWK